MGLVYVVGFCTTDFPDGTTGSVPACWAWAALREPARTSDPTNANRTDGNFFRSNFFMRLSPCTQLTVTRRRYGRTLSLSRTKWRFGGPTDESCQAERVTLHAPGQHPAVAAGKRGQRRVAILMLRGGAGVVPCRVPDCCFGTAAIRRWATEPGIFG